jgi:hypothetical protein
VSSIKQPDNSLLVAVEDGRILAVGSVTDAGKITLTHQSTSKTTFLLYFPKAGATLGA